MNKFPKSFQYTNSLGAHKELSVHEKVDDKYPVFLWNLDTGEFCGYNEITAQRLNDFLKLEGIEERVD